PGQRQRSEHLGPDARHPRQQPRLGQAALDEARGRAHRTDRVRGTRSDADLVDVEGADGHGGIRGVLARIVLVAVATVGATRRPLHSPAPCDERPWTATSSTSATTATCATRPWSCWRGPGSRSRAACSSTATTHWRRATARGCRCCARSRPGGSWTGRSTPGPCATGPAERTPPLVPDQGAGCRNTRVLIATSSGMSAVSAQSPPPTPNSSRFTVARPDSSAGLPGVQVKWSATGRLTPRRVRVPSATYPSSTARKRSATYVARENLPTLKKSLPASVESRSALPVEVPASWIVTSRRASSSRSGSKRSFVSNPPKRPLNTSPSYFVAKASEEPGACT